jgi:hypothetical protein
MGCSLSSGKATLTARLFHFRITRAKRHCCVICDSETVSQSPFIRNLLAWIEEHGDSRSALEYSTDRNASAVESDLFDAELFLNSITKSTKPGKSMSKADNKKEDERRKELVAVIEKFVKSAVPGNVLALSSELTSYDRMLVHDEAERLGVQHRSDGDGSGRRIILSIAETDASNGNVTASAETFIVPIPGSDDDVKIDDDVEECDEPTGQFAALTVNYEDEKEDVDDLDVDAKLDFNSDHVDAPIGNLLGKLANERRQREQQRLLASSREQTIRSNAKTTTKKTKAQKLGGSKKATEIPKVDESLADLDDMAFLDAQIDKVQTSHGRRIDAKGTGYRTIVNGILLTKPKPEEKKKDANKAAALQKKLQQAQADRKTKNTRK